MFKLWPKLLALMPELLRFSLRSKKMILYQVVQSVLNEAEEYFHLFKEKFLCFIKRF